MVITWHIVKIDSAFPFVRWKMAAKVSPILIASVLIALVVGVAVGYASRTNELLKAQESKNMLEEELKAKTVGLAFVAESGQMAHDLWLIIAPLKGGKYAVTIRGEGLDQKGGIYLVEGIQRADKKMVPLAPSMQGSEFAADEKFNGLYWVVLDKDPRATFEKLVLLFLPGMQMEKAILVASVVIP